MNWGRKVHTGLQLLTTLKPMYADLASHPETVKRKEFLKMSRLRMAVCDVMWQVEHTQDQQV
jgi:hypothetical protein